MKYMHLIFILAITMPPCYSQSEQDLSISITLENDTMFVFDPFHVKVLVKNSSPHAVRVLPISADQGRINKVGSIDIEFRYPTDSLWHSTKQILNYHNEQAFSIRPHDYSLELKPDQILSATYDLPPISTLNPAAQISIRASYFYIGTGLNSYSNTQIVYFKNYTGEDKLAYQFLKEKPRPDFLYYPFFSVFVDRSDIEHAVYIVEHYPNSKFSLYCKLFLTISYYSLALEAAQSDKDSELAITRLRECKKYGFSILESKELKFIKKSEEILNSLQGFISTYLYPEPSEELLREFSYTPKH